LPHESNTEQLNLTNPPFKTFFLRVFGNSGKLPYQLKLIILVGVITGIGYTHAYVMNVTNIFAENIRGLFFTPTVVIIIAIAFVYVLKQIDPTLKQLNEVFLRSESDFKRFKEFVNNWRKPETSSFYYLSIVIFATISFYISIFAYFPMTYNFSPPDVVVAYLVKNGTVSLFTYVYYSLCAILWGIFVGIGFNRLFYGVKIIRNYGKCFISSDKIGFIHAIRQEGITYLANFAVKIDIIVAAVTLWSAYRLFENILKQEPYYFQMGYLVVCIFVFVIFSIFPLLQLHKEMVKAKKRLISSIDERIHQVHEQLNQGTNGISLFNDLIDFRSKVNKMNTWGSNTGISIRMLMLFILPIVLGALIQIMFERVLPQFLLFA